MNIIDDYISFHANPKCLFILLISGWLKKEYFPKHSTERAIHSIFKILPNQVSKWGGEKFHLEKSDVKCFYILDFLPSATEFFR